MAQVDTTRIDQKELEEKLFQETTEILEIFERQQDFQPTRNVVISSKKPAEVLCDYFKNAKFSRG